VTGGDKAGRDAPWARSWLARLRDDAVGWWEAHALGVLIVVSIGLLLVGKLDLRLVSYLRDGAADTLMDVMPVAKAPVVALRDAADATGALLAVHAENRRLREENRELTLWRREAVRLAIENEGLRQALRMPRGPGPAGWTAARIVADSGGPFVHTRLIDAGRDRGLRAGMPVMTEAGLVGQLVAVGEQSSRVLLVTDFNSKIPVLIEGSLDQAILEGTNGAFPQLRFLPRDLRLTSGARVVTSGQDGVLPPGLPIGEIVQAGAGGIAVRPFVDWRRLDRVIVLDIDPVAAPDRDGAPVLPLGVVAPGPATAALP
jgi:rod shape-determining protein MreC